MITEIPTPDDFGQSGVNLLNLAWSIGMTIVSEVEDAGLAEWDTEGEVADEYWHRSQPALGNALALVQQAQEMALKGKIAAVSPYLLIAGEPRDWPRRCEREDTPFSAFRTVNAADLLKIHNSVCPPDSRLGSEFEAFFDEVRRQRNSIIHVGGAGRRVEVAELFLNVLRTNEHLYPGTRWIDHRRSHFESDPIPVGYASEYTAYALLTEFHTAIRLLKPSQSKRYFGLTKARRYICPQCHHESGDMGVDQHLPLAQLAPNAPSATTVHCFVCGAKTKVTRQACNEESCRSNVICAEHDWGQMCLVCGFDQEPPARDSEIFFQR